LITAVTFFVAILFLPKIGVEAHTRNLPNEMPMSNGLTPLPKTGLKWFVFGIQTPEFAKQQKQALKDLLT